MNCAEIRSGFVAGRVPAGGAVDAHLASCPHCAELFARDARLGRSLAEAVLPAAVPGDLFARIDRDLSEDVGMRARLRALPTRTRAAVLAVLGLLLLVSQLFARRRTDFEAYSPVVFWGVVAALSSALVYGSLRLARGATAPLYAAERDRPFAVLLLLLPALVALVSPMGSATETGESGASWGNPFGCFGYGAAHVAPFLLVAWLFERREQVPLVVLITAGALSGVVATLVLHAHCASAHLGHLLLGHASVGVAWALALGLVSRQFARAG